MKKKNIKGFTLLELVVAMAIFTIVIFIGYKIMDQTTKSIKDQGNINKGQLTMNDMNEYLTKDLEQATSIKLSLNNREIADTLTEGEEDSHNILTSKIIDIKNSLVANNDTNYDYEIRFSNDIKSDYSVRYKVTVNKYNQNKRHTISREEKDGTKISFINNDILRGEELPFTIEGNNPYKVSLGYSGKENKFNNHSFWVTSRIDNIVDKGNTNPPIDPEPPKPPDVEDIVPPLDWGEHNTIGFWTADNQQKKNNNLYTWVSTEGKILGDAYANQNITEKEKFSIKGYARPGNNESTDSFIGYNATSLTWEGIVEDVKIGEKGISKISIYISPYTKLDNFKITPIQGGNVSIEVPQLKEGWNNCVINKNGNNPVNFKLEGKLSIDKSKVSSGYAYVVYERADSYSSKGDIVYRWETQGNKYNVEAYASVGSDKNKRNEYQQNENRNMSIQIDKGSIPTIVRARGLDSEIATSDNMFNEIKAIEMIVEGKLRINDINFNGKKIQNLNNGNSSVILHLDNSKMSNNLEANFNFSNMKNNKDFGNLIINFIY